MKGSQSIIWFLIALVCACASLCLRFKIVNQQKHGQARGLSIAAEGENLGAVNLGDQSCAKDAPVNK